MEESLHKGGVGWREDGIFQEGKEVCAMMKKKMHGRKKWQEIR